MFRNRTNSQKPNDELLEHFKQTFPQLAASTRPPAVPVQGGGTTLTDALDVAHQPRAFGDAEDIKDQDPTPRAANEPWRFTPSLLDPNSFAFASFANQPPGYYTPTPGGMNTIYHNQAGDLHTPGFSFGLGTPLSLPTSEGALNTVQASTAPLHGFHPTAIAAPHFQNPNPFGIPPQQAFAPQNFSHAAPATFDPLAPPPEDSSMDGIGLDVDMQEQSPVLTFPPQNFDGQQIDLQQPPVDFRFHVTLNAPTAMIKHAQEIPVTYLNKGQAYSIQIVDRNSQMVPLAPLPKYRTYIRISFDDEQQRQKPAACWQLWKEGRGTNEAHQRGGKLQAVEFVDPSQVGAGDMAGRPKVDLESASFDGFAVTWTPVPNGPAECTVAVRFNFLSTDFSHSKGVKGIPVRLCAKTELLEPPEPVPPDGSNAEVCYCKVKLFRDHGAERKLSNDIAHIKKTIDKIKQQIAQAEAGMKDFGKRRRSGSVAKVPASNRPGKVPKHKRTWSMSSASSTGNRVPAEEDLHSKLATLQDMFTSTRPASVLHLKGDETDDPDKYPVHLSGEPQDLTKVDGHQADGGWERRRSNTGATSSIVSPTPSSQSINSGGRPGSAFQHPTPFGPPSRMSSNEWRNLPQTATGDIPGVGARTISPPGVPIKVKRQLSGENDTLSGWIEALGVDYSYQPPPERVVKPVACFYAQIRVAGKDPEDPYYRAIYLMQRTLKDLVNGIATKANVEPTQVVRALRVNSQGLSILLDDQVVQEIPEGQDMTAEIVEVKPQSPMKREWDAGPTDVQVDGDVGAIENVNSAGYELRLLY